MEATLSFQLLGGAEILYGGKPLALTAVKTRALLFYLAITNRLHSRDALASLLWPDMPDATAKTNLRQALTVLRKLLPNYMVITRHDVVLNLADAVVDVAEFETAVRQGGSQDIVQLQQAARHYRGDFLQGFVIENADTFGDWLLPLRERLRSLALQTLHTLADHFTRRRAVSEGLHYAGQLLLLGPWREESHQQMMRLLAWDGQLAAALTQYKTCAALLDEELGVEPLPETTQLYERILDARHAKRASLPPAPDPFIDREELGEVISWLHEPDCRLLTVVGVGGAGKTRLVMQTAVQQATLFLDGVYFVELAGLEDGSQVPNAIASSLGLTFGDAKPPQAQLEDFLRYKETLLVLDNFEHLLSDGHADMAIELLLALLATASELKLLLSSRERLNLAEEWVFELQGLPFPTDVADPALASYASIQLFQQTAVRGRRGFDWATEQTAVVEICQLVQGLPLGIKLAAALVKGQTAVQIAQALRSNLDVLTTRLRNVPGRHRSLRATFDYSWQLLTPAEQTLLASLSLFRGGFGLEAAQVVANATLDVLTILVDKSLLSFADNNRYELHVLLREFAAERFGQDDLAAVRGRYSDHFLRWLGDLAEAIQGSGSKTAVFQIRYELDNIRQAWRWAVAQHRFTHLAAALT
ncbi:MAG: BTAD domain-containing putative transcriptional regulator, partial [Chloroflexota bacterium]